jgi:lysophospholipid acyltransferase (LPLAT)-like uncharacterized protein
MSLLRKVRWYLVGVAGKLVLWLWAKSTRMIIIGKEDYLRLRKQKKPVIFLVWHGRIFIVPYFFRRRGIMPLISPSEDGEIAAQIMERWGYKILRGSSSHAIIKAWNQMRDELNQGGELIIVPDGPRGPNRRLKPGCIKLAQETGAYLIPFTFSASRKKFLKSWDSFLMFRPVSKVVALYGQPCSINSDLNSEEFESARQRVESILCQLDEKADKYFE